MNDNLVDGATIEIPNDATLRWANPIQKSGVSNVTFNGSGLIKAHGVVNRALLELTGGCENWQFNATRWDCNQTEQDDTYVPYATYRNAPLFVTGAANQAVFLRGCSIQDIYTDGLLFYLGAGVLVIDGCTFTAKAHRRQQAGCMISISKMDTEKIQITNNKFLCAMPVNAGGAFDPTFGFGGILISEMDSRRGLITGNTFEFIGRNNTTAHRVAAIDFYSSCRNWDVSNNDLLSNWTAFRVSRSQDIDFTRNRVYAYGQPSDGGILTVSSGVLIDSVINAERVRMSSNSITHVGPGATSTSSAVQLSCSNNDGAVIDSEITDNQISGFSVAAHALGSMDGLTVARNTSRGCLTGVTIAEYGGAGGTASNRRFNRIDISHNKLRRSAAGQGCNNGILATLPDPYTGQRTPLTIEGNEIEGHSQAGSVGITTFGADVYLRNNSVDKVNVGYYTRGKATNFIQTGGCTATNCNQLEDFADAQVTREQPIDSAASLRLDALTPLAAYSTQRRLLSAYTGPCMKVRESGGDTLTNIGFLLDSSTDRDQLAAFSAASHGFTDTIYDQSGNGQHLLQASKPAQLRAATAGQWTNVGGRLIPIGSAATHMAGGTFTLTDFTFFLVAKFSATAQGVFNFGAPNAAALFWISGQLTHRRASGGATIACPTGKLVQVTGYSSNSLRTIRLGGVDGTPDTNPVAPSLTGVALTYGALGAAIYNMAGSIGELIIIPGAVSEANKRQIEANQTSYWRIAQ